MRVIDSILWSTATVLIVFCGLFFTFKLKFVQFRFKDMFKNIFKKGNSTITPFQALMTVLGGRIGVGSIAGVALAIYLGGPGTIFWFWVIGILSAANTFAETVLGVKYNEYDGNNIYKGGPSYYLKKGLNKKKLSIVYAIILIITYMGGFLSIQANTIAKVTSNSFQINNIIIGIILSILTLLIIMGGIKRISKIASKVVPIMLIIFVISSSCIIITNINQIPKIFFLIITSAFDFKAYSFGIFANMIIGIQRGIFSNESGLGTAAIASSTLKPKYAASQGFVQMLGTYIITFLICTLTAFVILLSNNDPIIVENGVEMTQNAFVYHLGNLGNLTVIISIILFAFSTILSGYYEGESNLKILIKPTKIKIIVLRIITVLILTLGTLISSNILWKCINFLTAILVIINLYAVLKLKDEVIYELEKYDKYDKIK